jgi:hypothetical protein
VTAVAYGLLLTFLYMCKNVFSKIKEEAAQYNLLASERVQGLK